MERIKICTMLISLIYLPIFLRVHRSILTRVGYYLKIRVRSKMNGVAFNAEAKRFSRLSNVDDCYR